VQEVRVKQEPGAKEYRVDRSTNGPKVTDLCDSGDDEDITLDNDTMEAPKKTKENERKETDDGDGERPDEEGIMREYQ